MGANNLEYTPVFSTPIHNADFEKKLNNSPFSVVLTSTIFLVFFWYTFFPGSWILRYMIFANLLVYYSWELIYFDSSKPGIEPSSPLSSPHIKLRTGHTFHFNYAFATLVGVGFSLLIGCFL